MTALPEITPRGEHNLKLLANVHPTDFVNPESAGRTNRTRLTDGRIKLLRRTFAWRRR
jgi:hypothetical protein